MNFPHWPWPCLAIDIDRKQTLIEQKVTWKWFPHFWPFVRESTPPVTGDWFPIQIASYVDLGLFFGLRLYQCLNKPSCYHWFEMPWSPCDMTGSPKRQCSCSIIANMVHINAILSKIIAPNSQYCFYADRVSFDVNAVTLLRGIKTHWACPWIQNLYFLERLKTFYFFNFTW